MMKTDLKLLLINTRISRMEMKLEPLFGAKLFFYEPETSNMKRVWIDSGRSIPSPNPVIADQNADFPDVFFDKGDNDQYKVVLEDRYGKWIVIKEFNDD